MVGYHHRLNKNNCLIVVVRSMVITIELRRCCEKLQIQSVMSLIWVRCSGFPSIIVHKGDGDQIYPHNKSIVNHLQLLPS